MSTTTERATLDVSTRESDALNSVAEALESIEHFIDVQFGAGYAEKHPALVSGCLQAFSVLSLEGTIDAWLRGHSGAVTTDAAHIAGVLRGLALGTADAVAEADAFAMGRADHE